MKKQELLDSLTNQSFVHSLMGTDPTGTTEANGAVLYRVNYFEVVGDAAVANSANFYVLDEGQDNETAYWLRTEPVQTIGV